MKKIYLTIMLTLFSTSIFATEQGSDLNQYSSEYEFEGFKNWSIQFHFGKGESKWSVENEDKNSSLLSYFLFSSIFSTPSQNTTLPLLMLASQPDKIDIKGESANFDFKAEYRPNMAGFQFGLSTSNMVFKQTSDPLVTIAPMLMMSQSTGNSLMNMMLLPVLLSSSEEKIGVSVTMFDFAFKFHFVPKEVIDPYLGFGLGLGYCGMDCSAGQLFAKLGFRVNIDGGFIFMEANRKALVIRNEALAEKKESDPITDTTGFFGFGLYL